MIPTQNKTFLTNSYDGNGFNGVVSLRDDSIRMYPYLENKQ